MENQIKVWIESIPVFRNGEMKLMFFVIIDDVKGSVYRSLYRGYDESEAEKVFQAVNENASLFAEPKIIKEKTFSV